MQCASNRASQIGEQRITLGFRGGRSIRNAATMVRWPSGSTLYLTDDNSFNESVTGHKGCYGDA